MNKRTFKTIALLVVLAFTTAVEAQQFESGGIAYNVLSATDQTVEVISPLSCGYYNGSINIPASVTYNGTTYDVVALGNRAFYGATLSSVTIPSSVTQIKNKCFLFATGPSTITIPASVAEIGALAFAARNMSTINVSADNPHYMSMNKMLFSKDTTTLVECLMSKSGAITLPQGTRHIAPDAFGYCQNITGVTFPSGLISIGEAAFIYASHLNNIAIPSTVAYIGHNLFSGCSALNNLSLAEGNSHYYIDGKAIYSAGGDTLISCHKSADSIFLPSTLRVLSGFNTNTNIKYVHVPEGVTTICDNAFGNSSLQSIDLPAQMALIDDYAFYYCQSLTRVGMPSRLDVLGEGCFEECSHLSSIAIPDGLHTISQSAFYGCESLSQITWGDAVAVIDSFAFGGCAFTELQLPSTLRSIRCGGFNGYYDGTIRHIGFTAPVDTIESEAFYGQPIGTMVLKNTEPPVATTCDGLYGPLDDTDVDTIIIPCGSLNAYQSDSYWGQFADHLLEDCNIGIADLDADDIKVYSHSGRIIIEGADGETVRIFDLTGRSVSRYTAGPSDHGTLPKGIYLVRIGERPALKVVVM